MSGRGNWFQRHRYDWIAESCRIFGRINRSHIVAKFGVSVPQASMDLAAVMKLWPGVIVYNPSAKEYQWKGGSK